MGWDIVIGCVFVYWLMKAGPQIVSEAIAELAYALRDEESPTAKARRERLEAAGVDPASGGAFRQYAGNAWRDFWLDKDAARRRARAERDAAEADEASRSWWNRMSDRLDDRVDRLADRISNLRPRLPTRLVRMALVRALPHPSRDRSRLVAREQLSHRDLTIRLGSSRSSMTSRPTPTRHQARSRNPTGLRSGSPQPSVTRSTGPPGPLHQPNQQQSPQEEP
jgi:hypothetical protein